MKKTLLCGLAGMTAGILGGAASVSAEMIQSYADRLCGDWYISRNGIELVIEQQDDHYLVMKAGGLVSAHQEYFEKDAEDWDRIYYLAQDGSDPQRWNSEDGRIYIEQFDEDSFWIHLNESAMEAEQYFYGGSTEVGNLFEAIDYQRENNQKADPKDYAFMGLWRSVSTDRCLDITPIPDSEDIYHAMDHLIKITENGEMVETKVLVGEAGGEELTMKTVPFDDNSYQLKTPHTLEEYDYNGMLIETYEKDGYTAPSGT